MAPLPAMNFLGRGMTSDALAQQVQFALTPRHQSFAPVHRLQALVNEVAKFPLTAFILDGDDSS